MLNNKRKPVVQPFVNGRLVVHVGKLRKRRTIFEKPVVHRMYWDELTYFRICTNAHYCQCEPDELIRDVVEDFLQKQDSNG